MITVYRVVNAFKAGAVLEEKKEIITIVQVKDEEGRNLANGSQFKVSRCAKHLKYKIYRPYWLKEYGDDGEVEV